MARNDRGRGEGWCTRLSPDTAKPRLIMVLWRCND